MEKVEWAFLDGIPNEIMLPLLFCLFFFGPLCLAKKMETRNPKEIEYSEWGKKEEKKQ